MAEKAILYDLSKCIACRACQVACKSWNERSGEVTTNRGTMENPPDLSAQTWIKMRYIETVDKAGNVEWNFVRQSCMHCTEAGCVNVCPTGALYHGPEGLVNYDVNLCSGCGYCVEFCPFKVPRLEGSALTGIAKMGKCVGCQDRVAEGLTPACVKTCAPEALKFGDRSAMLKVAQARVDVIKKRFPDATIWGDKQLGGLHVIYVLDRAPASYGLLTDPQLSGAAAFKQNILEPLGLALGGLTVAGLAINMFVARARSGGEES